MNLGILQINNFVLSINSAFDTNTKPDHFVVILHQIKNNLPHYVDIVEKFKTQDRYFDFAKPSGAQDQKELASWRHNKMVGMTMPTYLLHKNTITKIVEMLNGQQAAFWLIP